MFPGIGRGWLERSREYGRAVVVALIRWERAYKAATWDKWIPANIANTMAGMRVGLETGMRLCEENFRITSNDIWVCSYMTLIDRVQLDLRIVGCWMRMRNLKELAREYEMVVSEVALRRMVCVDESKLEE